MAPVTRKDSQIMNVVFPDAIHFQNEAHTDTDVPFARHELWPLQADGDFREPIPRQPTVPGPPF